MSFSGLSIVFVVLLQLAADNPLSPVGWQLKKLGTLKNIPKIVESKRTGDEVLLVVSNEGDAPLLYYGAGTNHIQLFQDTADGDSWEAARWDWCGTGKEVHTIEPGKSVHLTVRFWDKVKRERMLGRFTEKDTKRSGLVVLATEPTN